jgi:hypothetical protein
MSISNFPNIRQVHSTICWAACIEMVARFLNPQNSFDQISESEMPLQKRILKEYYSIIPGQESDEQILLDTFCQIGDGYPTLSHDEKHYENILKKVFNIKAVQKFQANIPTFTALKRHTDAGKPVILGLKFPGIQNGNHAIVVVNCIKRDDVNLICLVDPFSNPEDNQICATGPGKMAFLSYSYLHNLNRTDASLVSVVSNFEHIAESILRISVPQTDAVEISGLENRGDIDDIRDMVMGLFLDESIFRVKLEDLKMREAVITSRYQTLRDFLERQPAAELQLLKVLTSKKDSLEVMIAETPETEGRHKTYEFVGIRESYFNEQNIASVRLKFKEKGTTRRSVNHFEPNYTLLHLQPGDLTFMVFTWGKETCYVSLSNMPSIGIHYREPYIFEELEAIILKSFPRYVRFKTAQFN